MQAFAPIHSTLLVKLRCGEDGAPEALTLETLRFGAPVIPDRSAPEEKSSLMPSSGSVLSSSYSPEMENLGR